MARNPELIKKRDEHLIATYRKYVEDYPYWRTWYIINKLASEFFLAETTIEFILFKKYQDDETNDNGGENITEN